MWNKDVEVASNTLTILICILDSIPIPHYQYQNISQITFLALVFGYQFQTWCQYFQNNLYSPPIGTLVTNPLSVLRKKQ